MNIFGRLGRRLLFLIIDFLGSVQFISRTRSGLALVKLDAIGDFVIWLDSAKEFRTIFPHQRLTLIANVAWAELAQALPYWDDVWSIDLKLFSMSPLYRLKVVRKIGRANFEYAVQPTYSRLLIHGDSVIRVTRATHRIGSVGNSSNITTLDKAISDRWYTKLVPAAPDLMMELLRNAEFMANLSGKELVVKSPKLPNLTTLPQHLQPHGPYFILFPGASWHGRQWPAKNFAEAGAYLNKRYGWQMVLCGASSDLVVCQVVADLSPYTFINMAGQTSLKELVEIIRGAKLLIANETSAVHVAAAVATPSVCILGGGHFGRFMPYPKNISGAKPVAAYTDMPCFNCNWRCSQPHDPAGAVPCITSVSVEQVLEIARELAEDVSITSQIAKMPDD